MKHSRAAFRTSAFRTSGRRLSVAAAVTVVSMVGLSLMATPASASWLGKARKATSQAAIVASVHRFGASETDVWSFLYGADGAVGLAMNYSPGGRPYNDSPTFSPEGGPHIVYVGRSGPNSNDGDLFVVDRQPAGGRAVNPLNITNTRVLDGDAENPAWAPSGGKIAFDFTQRGGTDAVLWWSNLAGSIQMPIECCDTIRSGAGRAGDGSFPVKGTDPAWSPNSNWIAYTKHVTDPSGANIEQLWATSFSGKRPLDALPDGPIQFTLGLGEQPNWSPLGDRLAYVVNGSVYVIRFDPFNLRVVPQLIDTPPDGFVDENPAWSPDSYDNQHGVIVFDRRPKTDNATESKSLFQIDPNAPSPTAREIDIKGAGFQAGEPDWWPQCTNDKSNSDGKAITGTPGPDLLCGGDGNSTFKAQGGDDRIFAGAGRDKIIAGPGNDFMLGGIGYAGDSINGGPGDDHIEGTPGPDVIWDTGAQSGRDDIKGEFGNDVIHANDGIKGNDRVDGGDDRDVCYVDNRPPGDVPAADFVFNCEGISVGGSLLALEVATFGPR